MAWIRMDDQFADHPKFLDIREEFADACMALWVRALGYCNKHETDGSVPRGALRQLSYSASPQALAEELVRVGLWEVADLGWRFAEFTRPNGSPYITTLRERWSREAYPEVYARDGAACRYCGSVNDLSIDHVTPRKLGGSDLVKNLVVACRRCNSRKGGRTPEQAGMGLLPAPGGA